MNNLTATEKKLLNNLTATEKKLLNNLTQVRNPSVLLGDKLQAVIDAVGVDGTPVNAAHASTSLGVSGVVIDGETVTINNPAVSGTDVYEFLTDAAQTKTTPTNIAVNISASAVKASGTLTMDTQPTAGDTITIGTKTYIFVPVGTANHDGEISCGADLDSAKLALVAAINGTDGVNTAVPGVSAAAFSSNTCTITALVGGTAGNAIATTETFTAASNVFAAATLGLGADCTAANAITALVAAITASDTQGVGAADGTGDTVDLTADVAGVVGNNIVVSETMANGAFDGDATKLSGGVDGTVSTGTKFMVDNNYLYVSLGANTKADSNWKRVSLEAVSVGGNSSE